MAKVYWVRTGQRLDRFVNVLVEAGAKYDTALCTGLHVDDKLLESVTSEGELPALQELAEAAGMDVALEILAEKLMMHIDSIRMSLFREGILLRESKASQKSFIVTCIREVPFKSKLYEATEFDDDWALQAVNLINSCSRRTGDVTDDDEDEEQPPRLYPVWGLFRDTRVRTVIKDSAPSLLTTVNSIWILVTCHHVDAFDTLEIQTPVDGFDLTPLR